MRLPVRTKSIGTKVTEAEYAELEERAHVRRQRLGEFVRDMLLSPASTAEARASVEMQVMLGELLALRAILVNQLFAISNGQPKTVEVLQALIEKTEKEKGRRAVERLQEAGLSPATTKGDGR